MEHLRGTAGLIGAGPPACGTGSLAREAVAADGAPAEDSSPQQPGLGSWGDRESGSHALQVVVAYGAPAGDNSLHRCVLTS